MNEQYIPRSHLSTRLTRDSFSLISLTASITSVNAFTSFQHVSHAPPNAFFFISCLARSTNYGAPHYAVSSKLYLLLHPIFFFLCDLPSVRENNYDTRKNKKENNSCGFHSLLSQTVHSKIKDTGPNGKKNSSKLNCLQFLHEYKFNLFVFLPNISKLPHISRMC